MRLNENQVRRLVRFAGTIDGPTWNLGERFYPEHRQWIESLAAEHGHDARRLRAASARLSSRTMLVHERRALAALARGEDRPSAILTTNWRFAGYALTDADLAERVLTRTAPKICAYDAAIGGDTTRAVIDTWMAKWLGCAQPTAAEYPALEAIFQAAARRLAVEPRTLQAAVWYALRGEKPADGRVPA